MSTPQYTIHNDLPYTISNQHERHVLDLYLPSPNSTLSSLCPLIVYIHGGAFKYGSKESELKPIRQLANGYALACINYRRSGEAIFPAMIEDCKSAVRFLKSPAVGEKYRLDASKVVVWGESAGGHAAAFLGTTCQPEPRGKYDVGDYLDVSSSVIGVVDYYGPTYFLEMDAHVPDQEKWHNAADSPESLYLGAKITDVPEKVELADPRNYVEDMVKGFRANKCPQFFIAHGTMDKIVPEHMSLLLVETLKRNAVKYEYLPVEGTDHVFKGITEQQQKVLDERSDAFLSSVFSK